MKGNGRVDEAPPGGIALYPDSKPPNFRSFSRWRRKIMANKPAPDTVI